MRRNRLLRSLVGLALLSSFGCGTHPVPMVAVAGTTIMIPMPDWFQPGFGTVLSGSTDPFSDPPPYPAPSGTEDEQRGETLFALYDGGSEPVTYLPVRFATRVQLDEGSPAGAPAPEAPVEDNYVQGQVIALVDIPPDLGEPGGKQYTIIVERWRRSEASPDQFEQNQPQINDPAVDWQGWGTPDPQAGIPITIVPAVEIGGEISHFTPFTGFDNAGGIYHAIDFASALEDLVPRPKVLVHVLNLSPDDKPAAWELEVGYPMEKIEILGVELETNNRSAAVVGWEPDPRQPPGNCDQMTGTLRIWMADPRERTFGARIAYRLRNFRDCGRLGAGEVTLDAFEVFDGEGLPYTDVIAVIRDDWSFQ